jgi:hypothetical protein
MKKLFFITLISLTFMSVFAQSKKEILNDYNNVIFESDVKTCVVFLEKYYIKKEKKKIHSYYSKVSNLRDSLQIEEDWVGVKKINTIKSYDSFSSKHKLSDFNNVAKNYTQIINIDEKISVKKNVKYKTLSSFEFLKILNEKVEFDKKITHDNTEVIALEHIKAEYVESLKDLQNKNATYSAIIDSIIRLYIVDQYDKTIKANYCSSKELDIYIKTLKKYEDKIGNDLLNFDTCYTRIQNKIDELDFIMREWNSLISDYDKMIKEKKNKWSINNVSKLSIYDKLKAFYAKYDNTCYADSASKRIVDLTLIAMRDQGYGEAPRMSYPVKYTYSDNNIIRIKNDTSYPLTVSYSGINGSKKVVIRSGQTGIIDNLKNGYYVKTASVNASNVDNYAGSEKLIGGEYEERYYISYSMFKHIF